MWRDHLWLTAALPLAYVLGSVPFGLIVGKSRGIDPRTAGSGNIGATNVGRLLGKKFFLLVFFLDLLKGCIPVAVVGGLLRGQALDWQTYFLWLGAGLGSILGHLYSVFLGFKGGKGVATSAGVVLGVFPYYTYAGLIALLGWIAVLKISQYVSVASLAAAAIFVVSYSLIGMIVDWPLLGRQWPLLAFAVVMAGLIVYKHRGNIARLRAGTEPVAWRRKAAGGSGTDHGVQAGVE